MKKALKWWREAWMVALTGVCVWQYVGNRRLFEANYATHEVIFDGLDSIHKNLNVVWQHDIQGIPLEVVDLGLPPKHIGPRVGSKLEVPE